MLHSPIDKGCRAGCIEEKIRRLRLWTEAPRAQCHSVLYNAFAISKHSTYSAGHLCSNLSHGAERNLININFDDSLTAWTQANFIKLGRLGKQGATEFASFNPSPFLPQGSFLILYVSTIAVF